MNDDRRLNGVAPQNKAGNVPASADGKLRTPTIYEALPYTPLSSIVPFTPDIIPVPTAIPTTIPSHLSSSTDPDGAKRLLKQLSYGAAGAETASKRALQTLSDVQKLLDPESLTQFKFKRRKLTHSPHFAGQGTKVQSSNLTPFAKMVIDNTNVSYRYLTPDSTPEIENNVNGVDNVSHAHHVEPKPHSYSTPQQYQPTPASQQRTVEAVVPSSLTPSQRSKYQHMSNVTPSGRPANVTTSGPRVMSTDQRQKGDLAVRALQDLLREVFEAEERFQSDVSEDIAPPNRFFVDLDTGNGSRSILQVDALAKLESCIAKVVGNGRFTDIEVEDLMRAQKLCEASLTVVEALSLRIDEAWDVQAEDEWRIRLGVAESGIVATRTLMRTMSAGSQLKELQSEDFLREILEVLKVVIERCIIPVIEEPSLTGEKIRGEKTQPPPNPKFQIAASNRKVLVSLMNTTSKAIRHLGDLLVKTDLDDTSISTVEYLCKTLIFAENANTEKESAVGIQNFEIVRRNAMDVLAKLFTKHNDQRQFIFDEILLSLEKLPPTKQNARQYKLVDAKPIQLVSALLMRLVQTSATKSNEALKLRSKTQNDEDEDDAGISDRESEEDESSGDESNIKVSPSKGQNGEQHLASNVSRLHKAAQEHAWYIVKVLTQRAAATSKNSEEPFRKLLDIFTEDFINVLGSSDWPAAELLLRTLTMHMISIVEGEKSSVPSRTLALELLGTMGSGILELQKATRSAIRAVDATESRIAHHLCNIAVQAEANQKGASDFLAFEGPYRYLIQYLEARNTGEDAQLQTARGFHLTEWAHSIFHAREGSADSEASGTPTPSRELHTRLRSMFSNPKWLDDQTDLSMPTTAEGRLASMVITINGPFCRAFDRIFQMLLSSMNSEHARVKSRSMASVISLLEEDASILDRNQNIMSYILRGASDQSSVVRDSTLGLVDKCLSLRPSLDLTIYKRIIERTRDAGTNVRKRALKVLKEIYTRQKSSVVRTAIADAMISRIQDAEDTVVEIARTTMEELWFHSLYAYKLDGDRAIEARLAFAAQAGLLIETVEKNENMLEVLERLLQRLFTISKTAAANVRICKTLVNILFDGIVDSSEILGSPSLNSILRTLTIFAHASPGLFTTAQLERLEPYTKNLANTDDLDVYRSVITILRNVMPHQTTMNPDTLKGLKQNLLSSVTKIQKPELREVAPCLWTIDSMLGEDGGKGRLPTFIISVLKKIHNMRQTGQDEDERGGATLAKLMRIAGEFGNAYNFDDYQSEFQKECTWCNGGSVAGIFVETQCPSTSPKYSMTIRSAALESICSVAQAWPKQFLRSDVTNAFEIVFKDNSAQLEEVLLNGLEGFFIAQEVPDETDDDPQSASGTMTGNERLGKTYVASDQDGASTALAQRLLPHFLRLALASCSEAAFIAARLVVSINKQGLVHPKESAPALVALETCPNKTVAAEAFKEHKSQSQKHENLFEKEYMRAVQQSFEYQRDTVGDAAGCTGNPPVAKLHLTWEVLKMGKAQVRKKFLSNLVQRLDFDSSKLEASSTGSQHLPFARFCLDNLAFFDYDKVDDLLHLTACLDKIFAGTGSTLDQAIASEVLKLRVADASGSDNIVVNGTSETLASDPAPVQVNARRLLQLALSSQILYLVWETRTFLYKVWNLQKHTVKTKQAAKEANKAANRSTNAPSLNEAYIKRMQEIANPIASEDAARSMCSAFDELISVDHEVKVDTGEDAEAELMDSFDTPSEGTDRKSPSIPPSGGSRGKKRKPSIAKGTPRKRGRPSLAKRRSTSGKYTEDDDEDGWD